MVVHILYTMHRVTCTVEPPNKGHVGGNINSAVLTFLERLSFSRRFKMYREANFWDLGPCPL